MPLVTACWAAAMFSGLLWSRRWTALLSVLTVLGFFLSQGGMLALWHGWLQLAVLGLTPWLLAAQQDRNTAELHALQEEEARRMRHLSESARSLLSLQQATHRLEQQIAEITELYHLTKQTTGALHLRDLFGTLVELVPQMTSAQGLRLIELSQDAPQVLRAVPGSSGEWTVSGGNAMSADERHITEQAKKMRPTDQTEPACAAGGDCWAPLWREGRPCGVMIADGLLEPQRMWLAVMANQVSLQLSRVSLYRQVESLAVTDALTGLFVRRYFLERAEEELTRSRRHRLSCTVLMVDLDRFKQKNDTFGHLVGDVVLRETARLLQRNLREVDLIARYGGEEIILLLIETDIDQALPIAQRLRQLVEIHPIQAYDELLNQTISIGAAAFPEDAQSLQGLIDQADQALLAAKRAGRNRVIHAGAVRGAARPGKTPGASAPA